MASQTVLALHKTFIDFRQSECANQSILLYNDFFINSVSSSHHLSIFVLEVLFGRCLKTRFFCCIEFCWLNFFGLIFRIIIKSHPIICQRSTKL